MDRWKSGWTRVLLVLSYLVAVITSEWIKVPLRTRDPDFTSFGERRGSGLVSDKLESLTLPFGSSLDWNSTKQMDMDLSSASTPPRRRYDKDDVPVKKPKPPAKTKQVTKRRNSEPFNIFSFIRSIRDSFFTKPKASVEDKVGFLQRIRDNILSEIKRRILNLFPVKRLFKRDMDSHEHDFISADGALVTICFLTFSVFLIKLVLQIIYIFKRKHGYYTMTSGEAGQVGAVRLIKRNKNARRMSMDDQNEQFARVMRAIHPS